MKNLRFEWHPAKAASNLAKHRVGFEEARTIFRDAHAVLIRDPEHSRAEHRFLLLGMSAAGRILVVCHCERQGGEVLRLISARKAERTERNEYRRRLKP